MIYKCLSCKDFLLNFALKANKTLRGSANGARGLIEDLTNRAHSLRYAALRFLCSSVGRTADC